jgi:radical SAM superfamily enzyme YgiQ (UPF0313 family)
MRVALINLMTKSDHAFLNLGALYIAAVMRENGHEVKFIDLVRYPMSHEETERAIRGYGVDLIAFSGIITAYYQLEPLSRALKKSFSDIPQIVGGSVGSTTLKLIEKHTGIDFVCSGEGERTIPKLLEELKGSKRWKEVPNIFYRNGSSFARSSVQGSYVEELDSIPLPLYDLVDMEFYIEYTTRVFGKELSDGGEIPRVMPILFSRGCPFSCSFCYRLIKRWRHRSIEKIIEHLKMLKDKFGIGGVVVNDELVFVNKKWFIGLCNALAGSGLGLKLSCGGGKPSLVTEEMVAAMKRAGFKRIGYGIESGSPSILERMKKQITVEKNYNALSLTLKHGLVSRSNFVFGHPGENKKTIGETIKFMDSIQRLQERFGVWEDYFQVWFATAYPGAPIYEHALSRGLILDERDYLFKVTSQDRYLVNLSEFNSLSHLTSFVERGLTFLDVKKFLRRRQYKRALKKFARLIVLYVVYAVTLGRCSTLTDLKNMVGLKPRKPTPFRDILRARRLALEEGLSLR